MHVCMYVCMCGRAHTLTHSLTHSHTHSLTHSFTHSLTQSHHARANTHTHRTHSYGRWREERMRHHWISRGASASSVSPVRVSPVRVSVCLVVYVCMCGLWCTNVRVSCQSAYQEVHIPIPNETLNPKPLFYTLNATLERC